MRTVNWVGCIFAAGLGGCSFYPIPDDVSPFRTEHIVLYARCEMRSALFDYMIDKEIISPHATDNQLKARIKTAIRFEKANKKPPLTKEEERLLELARLAKVAVVYTFDFNITEHNKTGAGAGFRLPWVTNVLDVGATAALDLTRVGSRVFGTEDSWDEVIADSSKCRGYQQQPGNFIYPLTGSIGVGRVVATFIHIDEQGGAKDNFVDTLTFTTEASGSADASVKLEPVPNQFRPVSATAAVSASRLDVHKLTVSLAFPHPEAPKAITGVVRADGDLNAPFERPPDWRARYNLCVQDARAREASFKQLRLTAPEVYCIGYADEFAPQYADRKVAVTTSRRVPAQPGTADAPGGRARTEQETTTRPVRPNLRPLLLQ
jgi:hypothetical protein